MSTLNPAPPDFQIGDRVVGTVYRILSDRILLRLPNGVHGIIRQRELSWDEARPDPHRFVQVGQPVEALVIEVDAEQKSIELSLRFAQRDPWQHFVQNHKIGDVVAGTVQRVRDFGVFVEVEPGVEGLLPVSEIRLDERVEEAQQALWVGDHVLTKIQELDLPQRRLRLSIKEYLKSLRSSQEPTPGERMRTPLVDILDPATVRKLRQAMGDLPEALVLPQPGRIQRILVADDHSDFRHSLAQLLREWGYAVSEASGARSAMEQANSHPFDLAILDLYLSDGSTLELATEIAQVCPGARILLLSGLEIEESTAQSAQAAGFTLEHKPFGTNALAEFLRSLEAGTLSLATASPAHAPSPAIAPQEVFEPDIERKIDELIAMTRANGAVLFGEDEEKAGEVNWLHPVNVEIDARGETRSTLLYSPVGDVIRDQRSVVIRDVIEEAARAKYLLRAIHFRSCLGIPVRVPFYHRPYALFFFSDRADTFSEQTASLKSAVDELGVLMFRQSVFSRLVLAQRELLRSQLRAGALHDVRNTLGSMDFNLSRLAERMNKLEDAQAQVEEYETIRSLIAEVQATTNQMKRTIDLFRELAVSERIEPTDVNAVVRRVVERQKPLASHLSVRLEFKPAPDLPSITVNPTYLQQVIDNVILNALQWCDKRRRRIVQVTTTTEGGDPHFPVKIRVSDTGPGIHQRLQQDKIYEMGFSQRKDGSGLGLFVARALTKAIGGKISVEQSIMEVGTTFLIQVPVQRSA